MLTLFEYLRKRACESIVAGVQDAVESLDRRSQVQTTDISRPELPRVESKSSSQPNAAPREHTATEFDPEKFLTGPATTREGSRELPPPRRQQPPRSTT